MTPVKDDEQGTSQAAATGNTTEATADGSDGAPPETTATTDSATATATTATTVPTTVSTAAPTSADHSATPRRLSIIGQPEGARTISIIGQPEGFRGISIIGRPEETGPLAPTSASSPHSQSYAELVTTYPRDSTGPSYSSPTQAPSRYTGSSAYADSQPTYSRLADTTPNSGRPAEITSNTSLNYAYYEGRASPTPSINTLDREVKNYVYRRESTTYQYYPGTERMEYDYIGERTDMYSTNLLESTAHIIKGSLGAGVLSMHEAYMYGGLWTSLVVTVFVGILIAYTMLMLISSAQKLYRRIRITKLSYPDLAEAAAATAPWYCVRKCSKAFRYFVDVSIFMEMCGTCCIYQIVIAYTIKQMLEGIDASHASIAEGLFNIRMCILLSAPLLLPLCLIRSLKFMAPFAMLADIFVAMCVLTTLYYSLITLDSNIEERAAWKDPHGFIRICGICMYCTSGICVALPVENNMKRPRYFPQAVLYATVVVVLLTVMTGLFGYWAWGEECKSPITVHMPVNIFTTILQFLLVMMLSTTFAVQFWVPFRIVWHYLMRQYKRRQATWERVYRLIMAIILMGVSMVFPNLLPVMIFVGQFFLGFIGLVFPAFIEFLVDWEEEYTRKARSRFCRNTKNLFLIILGFALSGSTFYSVKDSY